MCVRLIPTTAIRRSGVYKNGAKSSQSFECLDGSEKVAGITRNKYDGFSRRNRGQDLLRLDHMYGVWRYWGLINLTRGCRLPSLQDLYQNQGYRKLQRSAGDSFYQEAKFAR